MRTLMRFLASLLFAYTFNLAGAQILLIDAPPIQQAIPEPPTIVYFPGLDEPLVATGSVTAEENKDLDLALSAFHDSPAKLGPGGDYSDYAQPLLNFIVAHPSSQWNAALYTNLGSGYYRTGYFSRAFTAWEKAWQTGRSASTPQAERMVDRAVGELARMHARVGHREELESLLYEIGDRPIGGPATEMLQGARDGLWAFRETPGTAYLCGPAALRNLLIILKADPKLIKITDDARSGPKGFSLVELAALADKTGLKYRIIRREPGQPIPVPSIVNWNVHHYAVIIESHDGVYQIQDPTFGGTGGLLVTAKALDTETSGYFLVPESVVVATPDRGWRTVSTTSSEINTVYGMGTVSNSLPGATMTGDQKTPPQCPCQNPSGENSQAGTTSAPQPMVIASAHTMAVSLNLSDTPVGYKPQRGTSVYETLSYNQREAEQPANFGFSNVSPKWTHSWLAYIQDDPNNPGNAVTRIASGGGGYDYPLTNGNPYNSTTGGFTAETYDNSQLFRYPPTGPATSYVRFLPNGGQEVYAKFDGATTAPRHVFLTQVIDPAGNTTTLSYDFMLRLTSVTDAMGRSTTFGYHVAGFPLLISKITDAFGRFSTLTYDTSARLATITDPVGITSRFTYGSITEPNFITQLTTPYGTSKFSDAPNPKDPMPYFERSLAITDPLGLVDFLYFYQDQSITGTPSSEPVVPSGMSNDNSILQWRNTYYWDRHEAALGVTTDSNGNPTSENFAYPTIYHWLHFCCNLTYASNQLGSIKKPLENRLWFNYPGMAQTGYYYYSGSLIKPSAVGRVLDDGVTSQITKATYNSFGLPLTSVDPEGRTMQFTYDTNNIDVLTVQQLTAPSTYTTVATFANYNSLHEPQTFTGADSKVWRYTYNTAGQLLTVTDPLREATTYNYDTLGRLSTVQNANLQTVLTLTYDSTDRVQTRADSEGYTLTYTYDNIDRVTQITYPDGTSDLYDYTFQNGPHTGKASLDLRKHTDRMGRVTTYGYDADRRLTSVTEPLSAATTRTTSYSYYENGVLKDITDANGNVTHWEIDQESRPTSKTYASGSGDAEGELYFYEETTSRLKTMIDALAQVKEYAYGLDNRLTGITYSNAGNATPDVTLAYDQYFPRLTSTIDGTGSTTYGYAAIGSNGALKLSSATGPFPNDRFSLNYDALGRLAGRTVPGGNESFSYDPISRLSSHTTPLGSFAYTYLGQTGQTTSRSVTNAGVTTSTVWGYDTNVNDRRLISVANSGVTRSYNLSYFNSGTVNPYDIMGIIDNAAHGHPWATQSHSYGYDLSDRLLSATSNVPGNNTYVYDPLDNATTVSNPGNTTNPVYNALNQIANWGIDDYSYTGAGNLSSGDGIKTYKWDAENRLVEIDYVGSNAKSKFTYDALGRRVVDVETSPTGAVTTTRYLWCGSMICESTSGSGSVLRRDMEEGELNVATGQKLIYMPDQLGSVRDVLDGTTGSLVAASDYSPYGGVVRTYGTTPTDYRYAGLFYHSASTLNLSATRPMDGATGRWLGRDPIRESGGRNLYAYSGAEPIGSFDPAGLWQFTVTVGWITGAFQVTFGKNSGQWNFGLAGGVGEGVSADFDPTDSGCHESGLEGQVLSSFEQKIFKRLSFDFGSELSTNGDASVEAIVPTQYGNYGVEISSTSANPNLLFGPKASVSEGWGEGLFAGIGAKYTSSSCSCSRGAGRQPETAPQGWTQEQFNRMTMPPQ